MRTPFACTWAEHVMWDLDRFYALINQAFMFVTLYGDMNGGEQ